MGGVLRNCKTMFWNFTEQYTTVNAMIDNISVFQMLLEKMMEVSAKKEKI